MSTPNREQAEHWNSADGAGRWITHQDRHDRMLEPFLAMILAKAGIGPGDRVLDVGCGCGATTRAAAALARPGPVTGIDLSAAMLARASAGAETARLSNTSFIEGDAQVHQFARASFDVIISRFGLMFFDDPVAAFANLRRAARPRGRLAFACWQPQGANEWLLVPASALAEHLPLPEPGPADAPGMFALADAGRTRLILAEAGWTQIDIAPARTPILVGGAQTIDDAVEFLRTGSTGRAMLAGADQDTEQRALASVRAALQPHAGAEGVHLDAAVWLVTAMA